MKCVILRHGDTTFTVRDSVTLSCRHSVYKSATLCENDELYIYRSSDLWNNLRPESMNITTLLSLRAHIKDIIRALDNIEGLVYLCIKTDRNTKTHVKGTIISNTVSDICNSIVSITELVTQFISPINTPFSNQYRTYRCI